MKKEAVLHVPLSQFAYAYDERTIVLRLRAAKGDLKSCKVFYGDRVDPKPQIETFEKEMVCAAKDDLYDYFETVIHDRYSRLCYYFLLWDGKQEQYYYERDFSRDIPENRTEFFQFPYIRREDMFHIPSWAKDMVMYHIFPDSFATGYRIMEKQPNEQKIEIKNGEKAISGNRLGGTLSGIKANLDYLQQLGINCIYVNPVFAANSYHKYDTIDYFSIDPCLGTKKEAKELVEDCHARGIRVLFDGVFNHCGPDFFAFRDVLAHGEKSEYLDWFYGMQAPVDYKDPPNYEAFAYVKEMPKLNTGNPKVEQYLIKVGVYWIQEIGIDGWRLDVANEINHDFWRHFRAAVRAVKKDALLIGEIWEDAQCWLLGDQFDSTMNYRFSYLCTDFFAKRTMCAREFDEQMTKMIYRYPQQVSERQMNFLDSHDIPRFLSYCGGDRRKLRLACFYLIMGYGIPSVFYGDECYLDGKTETQYRQGMRWDTSDTFAGDLKEWISFRKTHEALKNGRYRGIWMEDGGLYAFLRENKEEKVLVMINNSDEPYVCDDGFWCETEQKICGFVLDKVKQLPAMQGKPFIIKNR